MISLIKRMLDANRLAKELEAAEAKISTLEERLNSRVPRDNFVSVAKGFDASSLLVPVLDKVVEDLSPFVEKSAIRMLKSAMSNVLRDNEKYALMRGSVAYDSSYMDYEVRFEVDRIGTSIRVGGMMMDHLQGVRA